MKDDVNGKIMTDFVRRYKMRFKKCLDDKVNVYKSQILFQSKKHEIFTGNIDNIALNRDDDKRLIQVD